MRDTYESHEKEEEEGEEDTIINSYSILAQHQTEVIDGKMNRNKQTDERKTSNQGFHAILCESKWTWNLH